MSTEGVRRARDALADIELVAQLRSAFAEAQAIMGQTLGGFGLTEQRYHLLLVVAAGGVSGTGQGALARALHCPESRISLLVHELSDAGLVEAVRDNSDRRHVRVRLHGDGEEVLSRAISVQREALHSLIATLEVGEVDQARRAGGSYVPGVGAVGVREVTAAAPALRADRPEDADAHRP